MGGGDLPTPPSAPLPGGDFLESIEIGDYRCFDAIKTFSKPAIDPTKIAVDRIISAGLSPFFNHEPGSYSSVDWMIISCLVDFLTRSRNDLSFIVVVPILIECNQYRSLKSDS